MNAASREHEGRQHGYEGRTLGGFRLVREIGCGGMATVYLGHKLKHAGVRQLAAVKVIHPHLARDADFVDMFLDEARIVSHIDHPNVCRVLDFGKSDGTYYLAMDYVMGETWADVAARMTSEPDAQLTMVPALAQVLAQACEGLHAAHEAQDAYGNPLRIVHRDVSPQNIMVGYDGSVRLLDFGIASAADRLHTTRGGAVKGRLSYMAPEQMGGLPVDRRSDVWSLGVILWEGLARKRLFPDNNDAKMVLAVTHDPLPVLTGAGHPVPGILQSIVKQALQRDPGARYASARELGLALSRFAMKSSTPIGMPELSGSMQRSFAQQIEQKRGLLREAADGVGEPPASMRPPATIEVAAEALDPGVRPAGQETNHTLPFSGVRSIPLAQRPRTHRGLRIGAALLATALIALLAWPRGSEAGVAVVAPTHTSPQAGSSTPKSGAAAALTKPAQPEPSSKQEPDLTFDLWETEDPPAKRPASRPVATGMVSIATPGGWAEVYLGSRNLGTTPITVDLPSGVYTLRLRRSGKAQPLVQRVFVENGVSTSLTIPMK